jgi:hypothetical protein
MRRARLFVFLFLPIASACGSHSAHALRTPQIVDSAGVELISPDKLAIDGDRTKLVIGIPIHMRLSFDGTSLKDSTGVDSVLFEAIVRLRSGRVVRLHAQQDWGGSDPRTGIVLVSDFLPERTSEKIQSIRLRSTRPVVLDRLEWWSYGTDL